MSCRDGIGSSIHARSHKGGAVSIRDQWVLSYDALSSCGGGGTTNWAQYIPLGVHHDVCHCCQSMYKVQRPCPLPVLTRGQDSKRMVLSWRDRILLSGVPSWCYFSFCCCYFQQSKRRPLVCGGGFCVRESNSRMGTGPPYFKWIVEPHACKPNFIVWLSWPQK